MTFSGPRPYEQFVPVPSEKLSAVRRTVTLVGGALIPLGLVIGAIGIPWTFALPTGSDPLSYVVVGMMAVSSLFALVIGVLALIGRGCVKTGQFNLTSARGVRRSSLVIWIGTWVASGLGCAAISLIVASPSDSSGIVPGEFSADILSYLGLLVLPVVLGGAGWIVLMRTLRP